MHILFRWLNFGYTRSRGILCVRAVLGGFVMLKFVLGTALALSAAPLCAQTVTATLPDYNGSLRTSGFPASLGTIGTFNFAAPSGATVSSAFLEGTYGTAGASGFAFGTASFDASIDGTSFTVCALNAANCYFDGAAFRAFSILIPSSAYASLLDGTAALGLSQTSGNFVRFGTPTLRINFLAAVPEPGTWAMMLLGFGAVGFSLRRRPVAAMQTA